MNDEVEELAKLLHEAARSATADVALVWNVAWERAEESYRERRRAMARFVLGRVAVRCLGAPS